jgi:hypothetical protein
MSPWLVPAVVFVWGSCIAAGYVLGKRQGRLAAGLWLTVVLSVFGLLILACWPSATPAEQTADPPAAEPLVAAPSIQPQWEPTLAQTDSWIWR